MPPHLTLNLLSDNLAICRLPADAPLPAWAQQGDFFALTRTADELSVVCPQAHVPAEAQGEQGWRALKVNGPLDFDETGILASLAAPLAEAGLSIFAISTFDTDYLLVRAATLERAITRLIQAGHHVINAEID